MGIDEYRLLVLLYSEGPQSLSPCALSVIAGQCTGLREGVC